LDIFYDENNGMELSFATRVAKSKELKEFEILDTIVLDPRDSTKTEGVNNSDFDYIEYNNEIIAVYASGNQQTEQAVVRLNVSQYNGNENEFINNIENHPKK